MMKAKIVKNNKSKSIKAVSMTALISVTLEENRKYNSKFSLFRNTLLVDLFKRFGLAMMSSCLFVPQAMAQVDYIEFDSTITATPPQFGNAGTLVHLKAVSDITLFPTVHSNLGPLSSGGMFRPPAGGPPAGGPIPCNSVSGRLECECVYVVRPSDVTAGQLNLKTSWWHEDTHVEYDSITGLPLLDPDTGEPIQHGEEYLGRGEITLTHNPSAASYPTGSGASNCARLYRVDAGPDFFAIPGSTINLTATAIARTSADTLVDLDYSWFPASMFGGTQNQQNPTFTLPSTATNNTLVTVRVGDGFQSISQTLNVVSTVNNGCAPQSAALMPSSQSPGNFTFTIPAPQVCPDVFWIDPPVASGYDYTVAGAKFIDITMPSMTTVADPDGYRLEYDGQPSIQLSADQTYTFPSPVAAFSIRDINPSLELDPDSAFAFALGIDLTDPDPGATHIEINQAVVTENYPPSPEVNPTTNVEIGYVPFVAQLKANAQNLSGGALTYDWTETTSSLAVQDVAISNVTISSPGNYNFEVTATSNGASSAVGSVGVKALEKECWPIDEAAMLNQLKIRAHTSNGNYSISGHTTNIQNALSNALTDFRTRNPNVQETYYLIGIRDLAANNGVTGMDNITARFNGTDLTLSKGNAPTTAFWDGEHLVTDKWYKLGLTFQSAGARIEQSCVNHFLEFRLPQHTPAGGFNRLATRPMEIRDPKSGAIRTINVPITAKAIKLPVGGLGTVGPIDPGTISGGVVGGVVNNTGGHNRVNGAGTTGRVTNPVIVRPTTTTVRVPIKPAVKNPAPTQQNQDNVEPPKEEPKKRRAWPWRR